MKYITTTDGDILIFSKALAHSDIANTLRKSIQGAGFVSLGDKPECYGESVSLNIKCHKKDTQILNYHLNN